jgi:hypothetical protein
MSDQPSGFTVTDRRKFTLEGELREGEGAPAAAEDGAESQADSKAAAPKRGPQLVPNAGAPARTADKEVTAPGLEPLPEDEHGGDRAAAAAEGEHLEEPPEPTAAETARQDADYRASSKRLDNMISQANPGAREALGRSAEVNFDTLVQSIYMTAALQLGAGAQPGEQPRVDILGARQSIDMLSVLAEKTRGNLTEREQRLLQNALFELRMMFMEITNAISSNAHNPAAKPPVR